jgi:ketosteroid isomerase-like protein
MSQENVEVVQRAYDMWNAGEMDVFASVLASDLVMSSPPDWPDDITSRGRDEAHRRLLENRSLFESDRLVAEQWIDAGDRVIVPTRWCSVPKGATAELTVYLVPIYTLRGATIVRLDWYQSVEEALKAVGLAG